MRKMKNMLQKIPIELFKSKNTQLHACQPISAQGMMAAQQLLKTEVKPEVKTETKTQE